MTASIDRILDPREALPNRQTTGWLDHHGIPCWDLCFMKQKEQVGADIYVDDTPQNITESPRPWLLRDLLREQHEQDDRCPRANKWDEVYELVHAQAQKRGFPK